MNKACCARLSADAGSSAGKVLVSPSWHCSHRGFSPPSNGPNGVPEADGNPLRYLRLIPALLATKWAWLILTHSLIAHLNFSPASGHRAFLQYTSECVPWKMLRYWEDHLKFLECEAKNEGRHFKTSNKPSSGKTWCWVWLNTNVLLSFYCRKSFKEFKLSSTVCSRGFLTVHTTFSDSEFPTFHCKCV